MFTSSHDEKYLSMIHNQIIIKVATLHNVNELYIIVNLITKIPFIKVKLK